MTARCDPPPPISIETLLRASEGTPPDYLDRIAAGWPADGPLLLRLMSFAEQADPAAQIAATGLLKRYVAAGVEFPAAAAARLINLLPALADWKARLQVLQMLPVLPIPVRQAGPLVSFLRACVAQENKFVRAWAYNGLHRVASLHLKYRREVPGLLKRAAGEEAPSVRARLRHLAPLE
jgi:hypothetical protein